MAASRKKSVARPFYADELPWTYERFKVGGRVAWTDKAIRWNVPTQSRRGLLGTVVAFDAREGGAVWTIKVLWDGYKRPHSYAGSFITKVKRGSKHGHP